MLPLVINKLDYIHEQIILHAAYKTLQSVFTRLKMFP